MRDLLNRLLARICKLIGFDKSEQKEEKTVTIDLSKVEEQDKFFGNRSFYDELKKIEREILPIKKFSLEKYEEYLNVLEGIKQDVKCYYEEKEKANEYSLKINLDSSKTSLGIEQKLFAMLTSVKQYKRLEYNFEYGLKSLEEVKGYLENVYIKLLANSTNTSLLDKAYRTLDNKVNEIYKLEFEEITENFENLTRAMCECIFIFFKCDTLCGFSYVTKFEEKYKKEESLFWEIFIENVKELVENINIFYKKKDYHKYYEKYMPYLKAILEEENVPEHILLSQKFMTRFCEAEKKIIVMHHYYLVQNRDDENSSQQESLTHEREENVTVTITYDEVLNSCNKDSIDITTLKQYIKGLKSLYKDDPMFMKLYLFGRIISDFKYELTTYEVYKLVYFLKLKTFFTTHIKKCEENDLMKFVFEMQKDTKVTLKKCVVDEDTKFYKLLTVFSEEKLLELVRSTLNKLNICFKEVGDSNLVKIYYAASDFEDCDNIKKNLKEIETVS